ncbi:MAG: hypothetical protein ACI9R3_005804 [Verrucomicrobiales bacterium]|jgi:hypothetical protein
MHNPYEDILPPEELKIGRTAAWAITVFFVLGILVPPLVRNITTASNEDDWVPVAEFANTFNPNSGTETGIAQRLRDFESKLEQNAEFARMLRRATQAHLTSVFHEGNDRTIIGDDGWLYFRPALQAITGYGPITAEPSSVAKDPSRSSWRPALGAITRFADQLRERGIELMLVPAPVKPMIYPEHLTGGDAPAAPLSHKDAEVFYELIRKAGITVIDAAEILYAMKAEDHAAGLVFLKQDTHWRPRGMQAAVEAVAAQIKVRPWFQSVTVDADHFTTETIDAHYIGDLVEKLDLPDGSTSFSPETVTLTRVLDRTSGLAIANDPQSPVVVLGDSFVNIFHDPGLGFAVENADATNAETKSMTGAGFAQHLAMKLGLALDVIAINGEASSGVRERFARRYDDDVRAKKVVVWVIAARDLFLSETPAKGLVRWDDVNFNTAQRPAETPQLADASKPIEVEGTITMKSAIPDPREATYKDVLFTAELNVSDERQLPPGAEPGKPLVVVLWGFQNKKYSKSSNIKVGQTVMLKLVPWALKTELGTTPFKDESMEFDLPRWFAEEIE